MSERKSSGMVAFAGRRMLALAVLPALVLGLAGLSGAQAQSMAAGSGPASSSTSGRVAPAIAATQAATPNSAAHATAPKGTSEAVKVHGHWTIEVRNPDGTLVKHVEFENSLDPGFSLTTSNGAVVVPGGAALLNAMLAGAASPDPASWGIFLLGSPSLATLETGTNGPCNPTLWESPPAFISGVGTQALINGCVLFPPSDGVTNYGLTSSGQSTLVGSNPCPQPGIGCNVTSSLLGSAPSYTGLQLTSSVTATQSGQIATVATVNFAPCGQNSPAGNVRASCAPLAQSSVYYEVSGGPNAASYYLYMASFTSSSNFAGAPISVIAGQIITATVNISFQ
jgi:hypothetical protein